MIALGIIGEYVWRTLDAARQRPLYVEDEVRTAVPQPERVVHASPLA